MDLHFVKIEFTKYIAYLTAKYYLFYLFVKIIYYQIMLHLLFFLFILYKNYRYFLLNYSYLILHKRIFIKSLIIFFIIQIF